MFLNILHFIDCALTVLIKKVKFEVHFLFLFFKIIISISLVEKGEIRPTVIGETLKLHH